MSHIYFILSDSQTSDLAEQLETELRELGCTVSAGMSLSACDILVTLRDLSVDELRLSQQCVQLTLRIPTHTPRVTLLARGIAELKTPFTMVTNAQAPTSTESSSRVVAAALTAFDAVAVDVERHPILVQVDTLLRAARELADSLSQTAQYSAALSLFEYSTETLIRLATNKEMQGDHVDILGTIAALLEEVMVDALTEDDAEIGMDAFVDAYDHVLSGLDTSYAMQNLDSLLEDIISSGRPITPTLVCDVLNVAFGHGEPLVERGRVQWVLQLYLLAAQGILRMVGVNSGQRSVTAHTARERLTPYEDLDFDGPVPDAEILVEQLSGHLYAVRDSAQGERGWEHDS